MDRLNAREARSRFKEVLDLVAAGKEVTIMRRGKEVARVVPPRVPFPLERLAAFRKTIKVRGEPMSRTVIRMRREERY